MNKFEFLRIFTKVVETHGFSAAARDLGISRSVVSKAVTQLEESLGVQLLNRSTRFVSPTDTGAAYYERVIAVLDDLQVADSLVQELQREPKGAIRLNAPMSFGTLHLGSAIADFLKLYPEIRVEATLSDRFVDPIEEGFDLTIRIGDLLDSSLIAKKLAPAKRVLCAAPSYLKQHTIPQKPSDLKFHNCFHYGYLPSGNTWTLHGPDGRHNILVKGTLCSNNAQILMAGILKGEGIALVPTFIAGAELQSGQLVSILTEYQPPEIAVYALYPPNRHLGSKVRLLIDFLSERFGSPPYWDLVT
ncbi:MAG: LysR family transcriptional regulator [Sneathiella sp.]|nr:LysR family transcriptional regulator [Sneathiella sp.]